MNFFFMDSFSTFLESNTALHGILVVRLKQTTLMTRKLKKRSWCLRRRRNEGGGMKEE